MVLIFEAIAQGTAGSQNQLRDIYSINSTDGGNRVEQRDPRHR